MDSAESVLTGLYESYFGDKVVSYSPFSVSGSTWRFRARMLGTSGRSVIGVVNPRKEENRAFIEFGKSFRSCGLRVPEVFVEEGNAYLEEDAGEKTLDQVIKENGGVDKNHRLVEQAVRLLPHFQITGGKKINYAYSYTFDRYGRESVEWDIGYFKRCFLGSLGIPYDEQAITQDALMLGNFIDQHSKNYFVNRDYQNKNIVCGKEGQLVVIDYQQGRAGALQYDIAKYLAQPSLSLSDQHAAYFLASYFDEVRKIEPQFSEGEFMESYSCFELIQGLQRLGAYANVGIIQKVGDFRARIIPAIQWFSRWRRRVQLPIELPEIIRCLDDITSHYITYLKRVE